MVPAHTHTETHIHSHTHTVIYVNTSDESMPLDIVPDSWTD